MLFSINNAMKYVLPLAAFLLLYSSSHAQSLIRQTKSSIEQNLGRPLHSLLTIDTIEILQYRTDTLDIEVFRESGCQINYHLYNDTCFRTEHILPAAYYTRVNDYFDRHYSCVYDGLQTAWVTTYETFFKIRLSNELLIVTEETFEFNLRK